MGNEVFELSVEHVLLFVAIAFLLYHLLGNCGCTNGFRVGGQGALIDRKPSTSCITCGGALITTGATAMGIDEIPVIGEVVMGGEVAADIAACSICGIDVGKVSGCMLEKKNSADSINKKLCDCDKKLCGI